MRGTLLAPRPTAGEPAILAALRDQLATAIARETGLPAAASQLRVGWLAIQTPSIAQAARLAAAVQAENVTARADGACLLLPLDVAWGAADRDHLVLAVAKVCHYLGERPRPRITAG